MSDQTLLCSATSLAPYCPGHRGPGPPGNIQGSLGSPPSPPVYSHPHPSPPCLQLSSRNTLLLLVRRAQGFPTARPLPFCLSILPSLPFPSVKPWPSFKTRIWVLSTIVPAMPLSELPQPWLQPPPHPHAVGLHQVQTLSHSRVNALWCEAAVSSQTPGGRAVPGDRA